MSPLESSHPNMVGPDNYETAEAQDKYLNIAFTNNRSP